MILSVAILLVFKFVLIPINIFGSSMYPSYMNGDKNIINKLAYTFMKPKRGDVVAICIDSRYNLIYFKRIIGLPGENIAVSDGIVFIDNGPLSEPYVIKHFPFSWKIKPYILGSDEYLIIGDNRHTIQNFGIIRKSQIAGQALW